MTPPGRGAHAQTATPPIGHVLADFAGCPRMSKATRRPRVVHVITRLVVGGAQLSVLALCDGLREHFDVRIVAGPQTGREGSLHRRAAEIAPLTVVPSLRREISPRWDPVAVPRLRAVLNRLDGDIVHTHSSKAGIVGRFAAAPLRAGVVHTVHGWGHTPADSLLHRAAFVALERAAARRCDALVAVSDDNRNEGLARRIGQPEDYRVIPPLVELGPLDPDFASARRRARAELGLNAEDEVIGWVGRFVEQKDPHTLARVVVSLLRARPSTRAVLVGDGPRRDQVEAALLDGAVRERVTLTGVVDRARELMPAFDVLVHPSLWEGQPTVVHEALSARIPVVSTRVSGIGELIQDGVTGRVVAPGASEEMAMAVSSLLDTPRLRAPLEERRLERLRGRPGREAALAGHLELYDSLLRGRC
jgi:glycosyltransferase involved in cell wall biosynthesis